MVPVIIATHPENGSSSAELKEQIKLTFAGSILESTVNPNNIKLENVNANNGERVLLGSIDYDSANNEITITPAEDLNWLTLYRLTVSGLTSPTGEKMRGTYVLEFTTVEGEIEDIPPKDSAEEELAIINQYPKEDSYGITPTAIRIKFNKDISDFSQESIIVTPDEVESIDDVGLVDMSLISGVVSYGTANSILVFTPDEPLLDNTAYTVIVKEVEFGEETLTPYMYSFYSKLSPLYTTMAEIEYRYPSVTEAMEDFSPIDIMNIIKDNSQAAEWIAEQNDNTDIVWDPPDRYVVEYVKTKTRYDILFEKYLRLVGGSTSKTLGDLEITNSTDISDLMGLLEKLKLEYLYWEGLLKGKASGKVQPVPFSRGENVDDIPDYKDRSLKDWDGTKSW